MMNNTPTTEERIWAVFSHLAALSFGMGILLPIVGWSDQRRKSNYASFQCLQALGYQSLGFTIWALAYLIALILVLIALVVMSFQAEQAGTDFNPFLGPGMTAIFVVLFGLFALYCIVPMVAAVACALGKNFHYPFLGKRLARYLEYGPVQKSEEQAWLHEDHEFRWVTAMGHFSILILFWGMLAPLTTWILQGKQNLFLTFQSMQALVYQALTTILYGVGAFFYVFGFLLLVISMGTFGAPGFNSSPGIITIVIFGVCLLIAFALLLSVPLLHILGQWAGFRILKGEDYRYPLIGRLVQRWLSKNSAVEEISV
jgi:uncharacterized Tic20 family protein